MQDLDEMRDFAGTAADAARDIALSYFRTALDVDLKGDDSPVTRADRAIERMLRERISAAYPDDGILGEEEPSLGLDRNDVWVIDPIDGTKSFVTGHPLFGSLVARLRNGVPCLGQIDMPALDERYFGAEGLPTTLNGVPCTTSSRTDLAKAFAYTTDPFLFAGDRYAALDALRRETQLLRFGGDCYAYALLAAGRCDLVLETGLEPYDYLPVVSVIEGASGIITDWEGAPLTTRSNGDVLASATPELHRAMLNYLAPIAARISGAAA